MKIYAPNIHLFAFQLYKGANVDEKSLNQQDIQLWYSANDIVSNTLKYNLQLTRRIVDITNEPKGVLVDLIKPSEVKDGDYSISFAGKFIDNNQKQNLDVLIKGFVYPIRIIEKTIEKIKSITESEQIKIKILNQLTDKLKELPQESLRYTRLLRNLKDYQNTIDINRNNYQEKLRQISAAIQDNNLTILETFYYQDCDRFYKQINADIGYFEQGSSLLEQATASIRGIVEIEQTKRDRNLNTTINTIGIGFGGGAIISGVVVQHIDKIKQPLAPISPNNPPHPFYASLFISITATLFFGILGWLISRRK